MCCSLKRLFRVGFVSFGNQRQTYKIHNLGSLDEAFFIQGGSRRKGLKIKAEKTLKKSEKTMTTKEVAKALGINEYSVIRIAKKCLPNKMFEHGKPAFYSEAEVTIMLDHVKHNNNRTDLTSTTGCGSLSTSLELDLQLKKAYALSEQTHKEIERILELKLESVTAEKEALQIELDRSKEWYSIKRMEKLNKGMHFDWRLLKKESQRLGVEVKQVFDANYGNVNAYHSSVWESLFFDTLNYGD